MITVTENICYGPTHWLGKETVISLQIKFRIEHLKLKKIIKNLQSICYSLGVTPGYETIE